MSIPAAIRNGDQTAFESVYKQLHAKLYHYLLKRTRSADIACEVTQLTFIRLWQYRQTLSDSYTIETQLFTIARTTMLNYLRNLANHNSYLSPINGNAENNSQVLSSSYFELSDQVHSAIRGLPPVRRKVFLLSRIHGLSNKEIAGALSISLKTVEDHITKAVRYLRSVITTR